MAVSLGQLAASTNRADNATITITAVDPDTKVIYFWEGSRRTNDTTNDGWIESATYEGQAMSFSDAFDFISRQRTRLWYFLNPATGANKDIVIQRVNNTGATRAVSQVAELKDTLSNKYKLKSFDGDGEPNSGTSISQTTTDNVESTDVLIYAHQVYNATGTSTSAGTGETQLNSTEDDLLVLGHGYNISGAGAQITVDSNHNFGSARSQNMVVAIFELDQIDESEIAEVSEAISSQVSSAAPTNVSAVSAVGGVQLNGTADGVHASAWFRKTATGGSWIRIARFSAGTTSMSFLDETASPSVKYIYQACHLDSWDQTTGCAQTAEAIWGIDQEGFRFRNDDGTEITATWKSGQDVDIAILGDNQFRLRFVVDVQGDPAAYGFRLEAKKVGDSVWHRIPVQP